MPAKVSSRGTSHHSLIAKVGRMLSDVVVVTTRAAARAKMEREYDVGERIVELEDRYDQAMALLAVCRDYG